MEVSTASDSLSRQFRRIQTLVEVSTAFDSSSRQCRRILTCFREFSSCNGQIIYSNQVILEEVKWY